jgi:DNA polymerase-3 subunit alpha
VLAANLHKHLGKAITTLVYFIARKEVPTKTNKAMFFGTFLDRDLDWIDTVHFPEAARAYPLHTTGFYLITGKVAEEFGVYSVQVEKAEKVGYKARSYQNLLG